jgi:hypothetical protein
MENDFLNPKNSTQKQLNRVRFALFHIIRQEARIKTLARKKDTRRKIQLGGLVKKAGLDNIPAAVLLGLLMEAAESLQNEDAEAIKNRWRLKGDIAFTLGQGEQI